MKMFNKATTTVRYEVSLDDIKEMIAYKLGVACSRVRVDYKIGDTGPGDPMDRYPAPRGVIGVTVTVSGEEE
jgi:hypothetical protein